MPWPLLAAAAAFVVLNLLVNALVLRLGCRALSVRRPDGAAVGYARALLLTLAVAGMAWPLLAAAVAAGVATGVSAGVVARFAAPPLSFVVPMAVFRLGLGTGWLRTFLVWLVWRVVSLAQAGLAWLAGRALLGAFADQLPPGWGDWLK
jgi:hypothetical protein